MIPGKNIDYDFLKKNGFTKLNHYTPLSIIPSLIWFALFLIIPLFIVIAYSFFKKGPYGVVEPGFVLSNYARVFEPIYLKILLRSVWLAGYTTVLCIFIAYPMAYLMARSSPTLKNVFLTLVIIPFWTNFVIRVYALKLVLGESGLINTLLKELHLISTPLMLTDNNIGVAIGMVYNYLPFMILPVFVVLDKIDYTLLDASYDLGASKFQTFIRILLPLSLPGVITGMTFVFIPAFGEFIIPDLMGGSQSMYIGSLITETFLKTRDWPFGSAMSSLLVVLSMISFILVLTHASRTETHRI